MIMLTVQTLKTAQISSENLFLSERFNFFVVFSKLLFKCHDLLLEVVLGTLAAVLESTLVHFEHRVEAIGPVEHRTVQLYVFH